MHAWNCNKMLGQALLLRSTSTTAAFTTCHYYTVSPTLFRFFHPLKLFSLEIMLMLDFFSTEFVPLSIAEYSICCLISISQGVREKEREKDVIMGIFQLFQSPGPIRHTLLWRIYAFLLQSLLQTLPKYLLKPVVVVVGVCRSCTLTLAAAEFIQELD